MEVLNIKNTTHQWDELLQCNICTVKMRIQFEMKEYQTQRENEQSANNREIFISSAKKSRVLEITSPSRRNGKNQRSREFCTI